MFLSRDPVQGFAGISNSYNGYNYAYGNPVMYADPSGQCPFCILAAALIATTVGSTAFGWELFVNQGYGVGGHNSVRSLSDIGGDNILETIATPLLLAGEATSRGLAEGNGKKAVSVGLSSGAIAAFLFAGTAVSTPLAAKISLDFAVGSGGYVFGTSAVNHFISGKSLNSGITPEKILVNGVAGVILGAYNEAVESFFTYPVIAPEGEILFTDKLGWVVFKSVGGVFVLTEVNLITDDTPYSHELEVPLPLAGISNAFGGPGFAFLANSFINALAGVIENSEKPYRWWPELEDWMTNNQGNRYGVAGTPIVS